MILDALSHGLRTRRARFRSRERGSILVEAAIALPILVMVILGSVTSGIAYNANNSLNNGARESARFGATLSVDTTMAGWLNQVADAAVGATDGNLAADVAGQAICVAYVYPDGTDTEDSTTRLLEEGGSRLISTGETCFEDGRPDSERRVQVVLSRTADIETVAYSKTVTLESSSLARYERRS